MKIKQNYNLSQLNAFKVNVKAKYFATINKIQEVKELELKNYQKIYILGEGTNTLFTKDFDGLIITPHFKGKKIIYEDDDNIQIELGADESWLRFVAWAIEKKYQGVENLSLIPGKVGAAPVQNIAAYGQNLEDIFESLIAVNLFTGEPRIFTKVECKFGYRESIFKKELKNKYLIVSVTLNLLKRNNIDTSYHSRYDSLLDELSKFTKPPYTIKDVAKAVIAIRKRKFPDWTKIGTAGSFFLNPVITKSKLAEIQKDTPGVQYYPVDKLTYPMPDDPSFDHTDHVKIAAGWLLEELGWKGKKIGKVGTSPNQALVLINYGGATSEEILAFSHKMQEDFYSHFGINLVPEVNII